MKKYEVIATIKEILIVEAEDEEHARMQHIDNCVPDDCSKPEYEIRELPGLERNPILEELNNGIHYMEQAFDYLGMAIIEEVGKTGNWEDSEIDYPRMELQNIILQMIKIKEKL